MKRFFTFLFRQTVAIVLAVIFILAFGVYSTILMPINLLPDINVPMVCVQVIYPGANAQSVEKDVTVELEEGLASVAGITDVSSYSYDNLSALVLSFSYGTDTSEKKSTILSKLNGIDLPDGVMTSVFDIDLNAEALAVLSVTGNKGENDQEKLANAYRAAQELTSRIQAIDGVEKVEIKGGPETAYVLRPYGGLELISPLIVQAFSYGALDIPLGNITTSGSNVQIRNNSDVETEEDILSMPLRLPAPVVTLLASVKRLSDAYENATQEELETLREDIGTGVIATLRELDGYTSDEVNDFAVLKTYMNIAGTYRARQLKDFKSSRYYDEIYKAVTNDPEEEGGERIPKSDEELSDIVEELKNSYPTFAHYITVDMLKVVRDDKLDVIIAYREDYLEQLPDYIEADDSNSYYSLTEDDYYVLETEYVNVYAGEEKLGYDKEHPEDISPELEAILRNNIQFAQKTSATGLATIADKKKEEGKDYTPTNSECALLFAGTQLSIDHPIINAPTFIAFIRSPKYESNIEALIACRGELGEELSAADLWGVYETLELEGVFEFKFSEKLFAFLETKKYADLTGDSLLVRVDEIATVEKEDSYDSYVYFASGSVSVVKGTIIEVYKANGANSSAVVSSVKKAYAGFLEEDGENGSIGYGAAITLLDDQSQFISESISNVLVSMLIGGLLAVLIIYVFLKRVRPSLIVAVTMPLSVLASLICLYLMGITLNMVSLGGLAVGIGMLVDNSIVVIECIAKHRDEGKSVMDAAVDGVCEVGGALFGSTVTTVCVFIPILFSGGLTGEIFTDLSWAVIFSLTFSLLVSITIIPALYVMLYRGEGRRLAVEKNVLAEPNFGEETVEAVEEITEEEPEEEAGKKKQGRGARFAAALKEPRIMRGMTSFYGKCLPKFLGKKLVTLFVAIAVFGASVGMLFITGTEFLPAIDKGQLEVNMTYNPGVTIESLQEDAFAFASKIQENIENIDYVSVSVGKNGLLALTDTGIIKVQLTTNRHTDRVVEKVRSLADGHKQGNTLLKNATVREIDGVVASLMTGADDMSVTIMGSDANTLREIAGKIKAELELPENGFKDVSTSANDTATQYTLKFDRTRMEELGIGYETTVLTLRIGIASYSACTVTIGSEQFNVDVVFEGDAITTREELENFVVGADTDDGTKAVMLKDILKTVYDKDGNPVKVLIEEQEACIRRANGKQMISVSGTLPGVDTGTAGKKMQKVADRIVKEYEGYSFEESGITGYLNDAFSGLVVALIVSFFLLYSVMAVQFGSAITPLIVMSSIPFSFTGGFLLLVATGTRLNVVSFIGLIMLMGVVVNDAIVLLEKIKQLHEEGVPHFTAVQEAAKVRLRPILMTSITTVLALIPLALGIGQGSELMQPLGIVVIGGLTLATLVTLVIVPTVYCTVYRLSAAHPEGKRRRKKQTKGKKA